ncbi:MAG: MFS transporter [Halioglobus sp.]|nr:MFS transporter [Halioglobus sp.]
MFALAFALGTGITFNGPSSQAITANAVPARDMPSAISLNAAAMNLSRALGPALAAPVRPRWLVLVCCAGVRWPGSPPTLSRLSSRRRC